MSDVDWNDLRYVLAVVRSKSAAAAARALGVSHATVLRRVQSLEKKLGTLLFTRHSSGYTATATGLTLSELALGIEDSLGATGQSLDSDASALAGKIRFTTTDSLAFFVLPKLLADFAGRYPDIQVELMVTNSLLDLDQLDADVSLRICANPPGNWIGKKLGPIDFGVYASADYLAKQTSPSLTDMTWILPCGPLAAARPSQWLRSEVAEPRCALLADSFIGLHRLANQHLGAAVLPKFVAQASGGLISMHALPTQYSNELWLLTLQHLKGIARIKVFTKYLADELKKICAQLEGF